ncbi:hypothetical protein FBU30_006353 [Linnemannia zychae]|nr:hypothetical protein FBU30_006353 [Linnemannia zychae]
MVKRDPNAHQSNHYKSTHHGGGKGNKRSGGKAGKGNKSINSFLGIGKPGPHLLKHKKQQVAKKNKRKGSNNSSHNRIDDSNRHLFGKENVSTFVNRNILHNNKKKSLRKILQQRYKDKLENNTSGLQDINTIDMSKNESEEVGLTASPRDAVGSGAVPSTVSHIDTSKDDEYQKDLDYQYTPTPAHEIKEIDSRKKAKKLRKQASKLRKKQEKEKLRLEKLNNPQLSSRVSELIMGESQSRSSSPSVESSSTTTEDDDDSDDPKDEIRRGDDFIGFEDESSEDEINIKSAVISGETSHAGQKRKRDADNGSDTEGATGPPPGCPWMGHRQYSKLPSVPIMLTQELKDFVDFLSPTREEHQVRKYVIQHIAKTVSELWPDAEVHVFGSYDTQLYLPSSDLDLVVLRSRTFNKDDLYKLSNHMKRKQIATDVSVIAKARVPIIKFKERISQIPVDISFNITNGIESAEIVRKYMESTPALRSLTMLIKHFLMIKGHNEVFQGGIGSYTTMIMILSFLQMHPQVQANMIDPEDNLGVLLIEFFELYGLCFNYSQVGLSVANGGSYFTKPPNNNGFNKELLLSSIDPNDPTNDTAKGSYMLRLIREVFVGAYGALTKNVQQRHRELFGRGAEQRSTHYRFDDHNRVPADSVGKSSALHHMTQVSLIKDVFSIPHDVMVGRQHLEDVFYSGVFQDIFGDPHGSHGLVR